MEEECQRANDRGAVLGLEWKELFEKTDLKIRKDVLESLLLRQLQYGAISSYKTVQEPVLSVTINEKYFQDLVLSPLEWFLFGEEPGGARRKLAETNSPPTLCGKVFKNGEPTYSCRDCALDATCVLCMTCFSRSIHKDHNYRLSTSCGGGGGCCDCGDPEAWKQGASCELHTAVPGSALQQDPLKILPQEFLDRAQCLFSLLLDYCVNLVCQPKDEDLYPELQASLDSTGCFVTVLFNDESHTFDGVIDALENSIPGCSEKLAKDFATVVDREGRSTVFLGTLEECKEVCTSIQDNTDRHGYAGPLRCETLHLHFVTYQLVALRLIKWLNALAEESDCFRRLHCILSTTSCGARFSHLTQVLIADAKLWKAARTHTHQLFMNTLLKDSQGKLTFAIEFTKNYHAIINDYYEDDQDHSISAAAMSVQLFTVPSLVQMLIVSYDLLEVVIGVFLEKTNLFLGDGGVFDFQRDNTGKSFRLYWVIHDLRYIFQSKPSEWTDLLKGKYYRFLKLFLALFTRFQGMGSTKRVTGVHVEHEPDWQKDFDFEMRLAEIVPLITTWCESERDVLVKSIQLTLSCLKSIRERTKGTKLKKHHEGKKSIKVFDFDVASEPVSIHIPVVRFLAGLIRACERHSINIAEILEIKKEKDILMYLEYPLKVLVMVAQVKAGMWKRNGYFIQNQVRAYKKDRMSAEMYDKDIFLMQVLASCMDKDHFLIIVLDMFKLLPWASSSFNVSKMDETVLAHQLSLAGEFLHLLIIILGERYKCTVGQVDADSQLRREIIHRLCLGTMPRSELMRGLPLSESEYERQGRIGDVLSSVATFKKPGVSSKGLYSLKKEYLGEFNPFFYHYSKNEQSKGEDYLSKRLKEEKMPVVFSPPVPVQFTPALANIVDLLSCKKFVELLTIMLWRIDRDNPKSWTDKIFHETLHLIGLALHEETRQREKQQHFGFLNLATNRLGGVCKQSLQHYLEALNGNPLVAGHSALLRWTIKKFNDELAARNEPGAKQMDGTSMEVHGTTKDENKAEKQRLAKERREKILLQMSNMQKAFIMQNSELYLSTNSHVDDIEEDHTDAPLSSVPEHTSPIIAIGNNRTASVEVPGEQYTCILCQEKPTAKSGGEPLVFTAFVQRSTVLSTHRTQDLEEGDDADPLVSYRDYRVGVHMSSCGHVMHSHCWQRYFDSAVTSERLSLRLRIQSTVDLTKREFLCPLCGGLGNTVLPLLSPPALGEESRNSSVVSWLHSLCKIQQRITKDLVEFSQTSKPADNLLMSLWKAKILPLFRMQFSSDMNSMITVFSQAAFTRGLNVQPDDDDRRVPLMVWTTCAYTIQCFEHNSRSEIKPLIECLPKREMDVLKSMIYVANSVSSVKKPHDILHHCLRLISVLPGNDSLPDEEHSLMDIDLFDWMVKMRFCLPSIDYQNSSGGSGMNDETANLSSLEIDAFVFHLAFAARVIQLLLTTPEDLLSDEMDDPDGNEEDAKQLSNLWAKLRELVSSAVMNTSHPYPQRMLRHVQYRLLPFLRCCALFFHMLNSTRVPTALKESFLSLDKEYEALSEYLALPKNIVDIFGWNDSMRRFNDEPVAIIVTRWCSNCSVDSSLSSFSLEPKSLIELPSDYSQLISQASNYDCPVFSAEENRVPAKCLVCGEMLCCEAYCCKQTVGGRSVGSCTAHALSCGSGIGIFLRVRDCVVLLINGIGKGCLYPSPYLDAYGETDPGLRRGNPLYLCPERYSRLQKMWKQHGIASEIVRHLESNRHLIGVDWANY